MLESTALGAALGDARLALGRPPADPRPASSIFLTAVRPCRLRRPVGRAQRCSALRSARWIAAIPALVAGVFAHAPHRPLARPHLPARPHRRRQPEGADRQLRHDHPRRAPSAASRPKPRPRTCAAARHYVLIEPERRRHDLRRRRPRVHRRPGQERLPGRHPAQRQAGSKPTWIEISSTSSIIAAIIVVALFVIGMIVARLYQRASKEVSFVRTGFSAARR